MQEMGSPQVLTAIDRALEANKRQREDLLDLRKMAVRRHGERAADASQSEHPSQPEAPVSASAAALTINDLIERYKSDPDSNFSTLSFNTRGHYTDLLRVIGKEYGNERLADINARALVRWHEEWSAGGKIAGAHSKITMLRRLVGFGATSLEDADCTRLSLILHRLRFEPPKARTGRMTLEQVINIRAKAHEKGRPSIALAQAFQSDIGLIQKDVIGEWIPVSEPGESDIIDGDRKWVRGLRWEAVNDPLFLSVGPNTYNLNEYPAVMEELEIQFDFHPTTHTRNRLPATGPIIVSEWDKLPWTPPEFRRWWRMIADEVGVPKGVKNSDSRRGED